MNGEAVPEPGDGHYAAAAVFNTGHARLDVAAGAAGFVNTGFIGGNVTIAAGRTREDLVRAVLSPTKFTLPPGRVPPSFLLRSGFAVVPFRGRGRELDDLLTWCLEEDDPIGVRLCVAPGGQGKTRLAQELAARLEQHSWLTGSLRARYDHSALAQLLEFPDDLLLVVDYAETAPAAVQHLAELLTQPAPPRARRRVLLLARSSAGWWESLRGRLPDEIAARAYASRYDLLPLFGEAEDRAAEFCAAARQFAEAGGYPDNEVTPPRDLGEERFGHALTLHMAALAALLDRNDTARRGARRTPGDNDPAARVLEHERRYWSDTAAAAGLPDIQPRVLDAVMLTATCTVPGTRDEAVALLAGLPDLAGEHRRLVGRYADWAHDLQFGERWLNPLEPDLLGEYFLARTLHEQPELADALADVVSTADQGLRTVWALARAADRYPGASPALTRLFRRGPDELWLTGAYIAVYLAEPAVLTVPVRETLAEVSDRECLRAAGQAIPSSYRVADLKIAVAAEALDRYQALPDRDYAAEAELLGAMADGLYYADRFDEAKNLKPQILRRLGQLAKQDPRRHLLEFIRIHISYGDLLLLLGEDSRKALDLAKQAKKLAASLPAAARPKELAQAHDLHARALSSLGDPVNALLETQKAVAQNAIAAQNDEESRVFQPVLLMNLANRHSELGENAQALRLMSDALQQLREMEARHPDPLWPNMIIALSSYARCLQACGQLPEARQAIADAAHRVRPLALIRPNFRGQLFHIADSWREYLSGCTAKDKQMRTDYEYIIDMLGEHTKEVPAAAMILASAMADYGAALRRAGKHAAAGEWFGRSVRLLRETKPETLGADVVQRPSGLINVGVDAGTVRLPSDRRLLVPRPGWDMARQAKRTKPHPALENTETQECFTSPALRPTARPGRRRGRRNSWRPRASAVMLGPWKFPGFWEISLECVFKSPLGHTNAEISHKPDIA